MQIMKRKIMWLLFLPLVAFSAAQKGTLISTVKVRLAGGELEGRRLKTAAGNEGLVFLGVPFAESPIDELRFSDPQPRRPWNGTWPALEYPPVCPQNMTPSTFKAWNEMSEDCLFLNIFAPVDQNEKYGVIFFIHGGDWAIDSPAMFPPETLIDNFVSVGVVFVTIQYRLGVFGFWSSGTSEAPGNYGIKDMVYGLQWIQKEIPNFGGNPNKVTLMGHSSGGFTASLLSMIPATKNLIHRVIILSGPGVGNNYLSSDISRYRRVARNVGCPYLQNDIRSTVECLRKIDAETLMNKYAEIVNAVITQTGDMPITAPRVDGPNGIIPYPLDQLVPNRHPIPMLIGTTNNEFSMIKIDYINATSSNVTDMCRHASARFPINSRNLIASACKQQYVDLYLSAHNDSDHGFWRNQTVLALEDSIFFSNTMKEVASLRVKNQPVWLYSFDYVKRGYEGLATWHTMDMCWVLGIQCLESDDDDKKIQSFDCRTRRIRHQ